MHHSDHLDLQLINQHQKVLQRQNLAADHTRYFRYCTPRQSRSDHFHLVCSPKSRTTGSNLAVSSHDLQRSDLHRSPDSLVYHQLDDLRNYPPSHPLRGMHNSPQHHLYSNHHGCLHLSSSSTSKHRLHRNCVLNYPERYQRHQHVGRCN